MCFNNLDKADLIDLPVDRKVKGFIEKMDYLELGRDRANEEEDYWYVSSSQPLNPIPEAARTPDEIVRRVPTEEERSKIREIFPHLGVDRRKNHLLRQDFPS